MHGGKWRLVLLFLAAMCLLGGCLKEEKTSDKKSYTIYYTNLDGTRLEGKKYTPVSTTFIDILEELLERFQYTGFSDVKSAMPQEVRINGYTKGVDDLQVDFDANYLSISNVQEVLLRAGLVKTLVQLNGVLSVRFTVDGQPLTDSDGIEIPAMSKNTFIDSQDGGINSYHYLTLNLYFSNRQGDKIVKEMRNAYYSSNLILEKVIVEQIISGPFNERLLRVTTPDVLVRNVQISKDICVVDLDESFNLDPPDGSVEPETCLYAFVNAICDACDVRGVQFKIDGESDVRFRNQVNLNRVFERNAEIIEAEPQPVVEAIGSVIEKDTEAEQEETVKQAESEEKTTEAAEDTEFRMEDETGDSMKNISGENGQNRGVGVDPALVEDNP